MASHVSIPMPRGLLSEADAALYLGIGVTTMRGLGIPRRMLGARRLYDIRDLDEFRDTLPYEDQSNGRANTCDEILGRVSG